MLYTYQSALPAMAGRSTTPPYPMKISAPPGCLASRSVAPSPTITRLLYPCVSYARQAHSECCALFLVFCCKCRLICMPWCKAEIFTLMRRAAAALPPLREVSSLSSNPAYEPSSCIRWCGASGGVNSWKAGPPACPVYCNKTHRDKCSTHIHARSRRPCLEEDGVGVHVLLWYAHNVCDGVDDGPEPS